MKARSTAIICFALLVLGAVPGQPPFATGLPWQYLLMEADSLRKAAQFDSAIVLAERGLAITESQYGKEDTSAAHALQILGDCYRRLGDYEQAGTLLNRALDIREKVLGPNHPDVARCLNSLALLSENLGNYTDAESLHLRALRIRESADPNSPDVAQTLDNLASVYIRFRRFGDAELYYKRALAINQAIGSDSQVVARDMINLGSLFDSDGRYAEAEALLQRALDIQERVLPSDHPEIAETLRNLAILLEDLGRYSDAEPLLTRALSICKTVYGSDHPEYEASLNNLASLYTHEARFADAEPLFQQALTIREKLPGSSPAELAAILNNLAMVYAHQNQNSKAESYYRRAIEIRKRDPDSDDPEVAVSINNLALLYWNQDRYAEAEPLQQNALEIWEKTRGPQHPDVAIGLDDLGNLYQDQDRYAEAAPLLKRALQIREAALDPQHPDLAASLSGLAINSIRMGQYTQACMQESRAWAIRRHNFRDGVAVLAERNALEFSQFMENETSDYLSVLLDSINGGTVNTQRVADVILSSKGQVSDGMLARNRAAVEESDSDSRALADSLRSARFEVSKLYVDGPGDDSVVVYRHKLEEATRDKERIETDLARRNVSFATEQSLWNVDAPAVSSALPAGASLVEFMRYDQRTNVKDQEARYVALVLKKDQSPLLFELGSAQDVDSAIAEYRHHLQDPANLDDQEYAVLSNAVYARCWRPFASLLGDSKIVFVAPDGDLNLVSFAGLKDDSGKYLIESFALHYLSTGRDLIRLQKEAPSGSGLLAMGDPDYGGGYGSPATRSLSGAVIFSGFNLRTSCEELNRLNVARLPGTRTEVEVVAAQWRALRTEPVITYLGSEATEENFKRQAPGKRVLHLATHGFSLSAECQPRRAGRTSSVQFDEDIGENPMLRSGFLLSGANRHGEGAREAGREDGIVTAEDVAGLNLQGTNLVVLSACESGLGKVKSGEGVYGLRRAFQMAGARTVISSLWSVDDKATAEFMRQLFSATDESLPQTMRRVALSRLVTLRSQGRSDHPFYWAAFIATGDWRMP